MFVRPPPVRAVSARASAECPQCVVIIWESGAKSNLCFALCAFLTVLLLRHIIIARAGGPPKRTAFKRYHAWIKRARRLFSHRLFLFALANGLSGSIISNYFKDVFQVDSVQRGLLEIPRAARCCGRVRHRRAPFARQRLALRSRLRTVLRRPARARPFLPGYFVMQLFVFTYSLGDHMVMPIRDAIAMDLADEGKTGTFLGRYRGMMTLGSMLASALVFVGFRVGFFYFRTGVIPSFCAALVFLIVALALLCRLRKTLPALDVRKRSGERRRLPVRRRYLPYYIVTAVYGFEADAPCLCSMGHHRASLDGRGHGGAARHRCLFLRRLGRPAHRKVFRSIRCAEGARAGVRRRCRVFLFAAWAASGIVNGSLRGWGGMAAAFASYILIFLTDHFNSVHVMLMRELSESPADVMENLSFGLSVDHVLAVTVSGLLGAVWKYVRPQYVFLLGAAVCTVHLGVALWLKAAAPRRRLSLLDTSKASRRRRNTVKR